MFTAHGKAKCSFPTSCRHSYPQLHKTGSYTLSHNAYACGIHLIRSSFITFIPSIWRANIHDRHKSEGCGIILSATDILYCCLCCRIRITLWVFTIYTHIFITSILLTDKRACSRSISLGIFFSAESSESNSFLFILKKSSHLFCRCPEPMS